MNDKELLNIIKELKISESIDEIISKYITTSAIDLALSIVILAVGIVLLIKLSKFYFKNRDAEHWQDWRDFVFDNTAKSAAVGFLLLFGTICSGYNTVMLVHWIINPNGMLLQALLD